MKHLYSFLFAFLLAAPLCAQDKVIADKNVTPRQVDKFMALEVQGAIDVYISQGPSALAVSAGDEKYVSQIVTEVTNGVLKVRAGGGVKTWGSDRKMRVYISAEKLSRISASGACDVFITGTLSQDDLEISLSGSCDLKGNIDVENLSLNQSGSSDAVLSGKATHARLEVSGASDIKAYNLKTEFCKASASGASDIQISVVKELTASASGASDIYFKGNPTTSDIKKSGASTIARRS